MAKAKRKSVAPKRASKNLKSQPQYTHALDVEQVDLDTLVQHPQNPRLGNVDAIVESVEANGFYNLIYVSRATRHIVAGNHRWLAAKRVGMKQVPVRWLDLTPEQEIRILLADNKIQDEGSYDITKLSQMVAGYQGRAGDLKGTGMSSERLKQIMQRASSFNQINTIKRVYRVIVTGDAQQIESLRVRLAGQYRCKVDIVR